MLHKTNVASEAAEETSTKTSRHRRFQVLPHGAYSFGETEILPGRNPQIEPKPVARVLRVQQSSVVPWSLRGGALPQDHAFMATGEMRGLGDALEPVPMAFRRGVDQQKSAIVGDGKDVRRVGNSLVPMVATASDYNRHPIVSDKSFDPNGSATTSVIRSSSMAPDDRLMQRVYKPVSPGMTVSRAEMPGRVHRPDTVSRTETRREDPGVVYRPQPAVSRAERPLRIPSMVNDYVVHDDLRGLEDRNVAIGVGILAAVAGLYWFVNRE